MPMPTYVAGPALASLAALAFIGTARPVSAYDGQELLQFCSTPVYFLECRGYFEAVLDMLHLAPAFNTAICPPREGLPIGDIIDTFKEFARKYPQHLSLTASEVIGMSLAQKHPCKDE